MTMMSSGRDATGQPATGQPATGQPVTGQPGTDQRVTEQLGAGVPDRLHRLWTPHRMAYIQGEGRTGCAFCEIPGRSDEEGLVVARGAVVYAVLNLYPYNSGHLMIVPFRHVADYTELTDQESAELSSFTGRALDALRRAASPQGFNVGMNLGEVAGAGIAAHLHQHVVPRWGGDSNFMPVIGRTKVLPQLLGETRAMISAAW